MHAFLITGGSPEERKAKEDALCREWEVRPFDILRLDVPEGKQTIGIADVRMLCRNLTLSPRQSPVSVGIIDQSDRLTPGAQNALLKTLEEPPAKARIILKTAHASRLLPTVVSRCRVIQLRSLPYVPDDEKKKILDILQTVAGQKKGELCQSVDQLFDTREDGVQFLNTLLYILQTQLVHPPTERQNDRMSARKTGHITYMVRAVIKAQTQLSANVNYSLVFDAFFLAISLYKPGSVVYN